MMMPTARTRRIIVFFDGYLDMAESNGGFLHVSARSQGASFFYLPGLRPPLSGPANVSPA